MAEIPDSPSEPLLSPVDPGRRKESFRPSLLLAEPGTFWAWRSIGWALFLELLGLQTTWLQFCQWGPRGVSALAQRAWPVISGHSKERTKLSGLCGYLGVSRGWLVFHWLRFLLTSNFAILSNSNTELHLCLSSNYCTNNETAASSCFLFKIQRWQLV